MNVILAPDIILHMDFPRWRRVHVGVKCLIRLIAGVSYFDSWHVSKKWNCQNSSMFSVWITMFSSCLTGKSAVEWRTQYLFAALINFESILGLHVFRFSISRVFRNRVKSWVVGCILKLVKDEMGKNFSHTCSNDSKKLKLDICARMKWERKKRKTCEEL